MNATWWTPVATDQIDADGERFSEEALHIITAQAGLMSIRINFEGPPVGRVVASLLEDRRRVEVLAVGELAEGLYIVPQFAYDRSTVTEEDGVKVYHEIKLLGFGLTDRPADPNLAPVRFDP